MLERQIWLNPIFTPRINLTFQWFSIALENNHKLPLLLKVLLYHPSLLLYTGLLLLELTGCFIYPTDTGHYTCFLLSRMICFQISKQLVPSFSSRLYFFKRFPGQPFKSCIVLPCLQIILYYLVCFLHNTHFYLKLCFFVIVYLFTLTSPPLEYGFQKRRYFVSLTYYSSLILGIAKLMTVNDVWQWINELKKIFLSNYV